MLKDKKKQSDEVKQASEPLRYGTDYGIKGNKISLINMLGAIMKKTIYENR